MNSESLYPNRPIIGLVDAIESLYPRSAYTCGNNNYDELNWLEPPAKDGGIDKPTKEELESEVARLLAEYNHNQYQRDRAEAYPSIEDQLDLLYHGGLDVWKEEINKIKEQFPKPEGL